MEQNKVLMIIVSVAIFFAAIVGVGVALLYPRSDDTDIVATGGTVPEFDPIEYVRRPDQAPLTETEDDEPMIIVYGERENPASATESTIVDDENEEIAIEASEATNSRDAETPVRHEQEEQEEQEVTPPASAETTPSASTDVATATPSPRTLQETRPEPRRIRVTEYWIQLIASPNRDRVEQVRGTLADYSLGGRVTTRDIDGELYYRLRVGPYDNHEEAEKFLTWIQDIEGFENAYISEEYPLRTVNG